MSPTDLPRCAEFGHPMPRYVAFECDAGHEHRAHRCGARIGRRTCEGAATVPALGPGCEDDEDEEGNEGP